MRKLQEKLFSLALGGLVLAVMFYLARELSVYTFTDNVTGKPEAQGISWSGETASEVQYSEAQTGKVNTVDGEEVCIVLDAGHGGFDPGKIGVDGQKEAEINLAITLKVKDYLEANDVKVVMTRETAEGLYDEGADNKKVQDMKRRIELMEEAKPLATVSIHQNSYTEEYVNGAQVFYYGESKEGEKLADLLQEALREYLNPQNHRQKKANNSYYLLKKTQIPTVIVECGFLSNEKEAKLLADEEYQDKVAWAIHMGIMQYVNEK